MNEKNLSRTLKGKVISHKMAKTAVVRVERQVKHPVYGKYMRRSTKYHAHDPQNVCKEGDIVLIKESRPISKTKSWDLVKVIEPAAEKI
jgi:small subunit ribosomal protein S17